MHHCWWKASKIRLLLCAYGQGAGMGVYCDTPAWTQGLDFYNVFRRTASMFNRENYLPIVNNTGQNKGITKLSITAHQWIAYTSQRFYCGLRRINNILVYLGDYEKWQVMKFSSGTREPTLLWNACKVFCVPRGWYDTGHHLTSHPTEIHHKIIEYTSQYIAR